ncbi:HAMP domain-containing protein [Phytoactinopolyspora alkaliphila]|uniref:histidine kinase n=1 Tax=Phytoactinopolyspora alkaliphila TaxID=1783498 RepID=A0A6N9YKC7_9ACTN|nr:sensor histidine kinase [Phytoactinopolyspora alkaliphila]NED95486.1 HAMP domain-containing protein [Phytoactinopolyspora alkaliphila]
MTRTARTGRGASGNPKRARAAQDAREQGNPSGEASPREGTRTSIWHTLLHDRSVRARVAALVIVPLLGTLVLGALFFKNALDDAGAAAEVEELASVGVTATELLHRIQDERDVSALAEVEATGVGAVAGARDATDTALSEFMGSLDPVRDAGSSTEASIAAVEREVENLERYRAERDEASPEFDAGGASAYHDLAEAVRGIVIVSGTAVHDGQTARLITALDNISQAVESASMERSLVTYHLTPGEETSSALTTSAVSYRGEQDLLIDRFLANYDSGQTESVSGRIAAADELTATTFGEIQEGDELSQSHEQWYEAATQRLDVLREIEAESAAAVVDNASSAANSARATAILSAVAVLAVLALTVFLTIVVARSIVGPLSRLRGAAEQTASKDLPAFVERIRKDGPAAARASTEVITPEGNDEIGAVTRAFNDVHSQAIQIAGDQALLRQNLDTIVVNLSRRTQSLVDRQLGELEGLEQRERDPDQLSTLFRIDHMATRVRRHAESLLVLAGVQEMRKQTSSAPVLDVVRTAVGEVEQYPRVKFGVMPTDLVTAGAVDDIAHMLAELIDNATEFSAPSTPVRVTSQPLLGGGLRISVADAGLGIPTDQLEALNSRLADVGDIDVATSRTLGLYVVARLSAKHGIRVRLEPGSAGGTVAQVDIPANLIHSPLDSQADVPPPAVNEDPLHTPAPWTPSEPPRRHAAPTQSRQPEPALPTRTEEWSMQAPEELSTEYSRDRLPDFTGENTFATAATDNDSPIFESVRSAWFSGETSSDWSSPADAGWRRAAEVLRSAEEAATARRTQRPADSAPRRARTTSTGSGWASRPAGSDLPRTEIDTAPIQTSPEVPAPAMNASGLPVRRRGASLVPGSISDPAAGASTSRRPAPPTKSADSVSSTLASLQRGVGRGRQETGGWVPKRPSDPERSKQ